MQHLRPHCRRHGVVSAQHQSRTRPRRSRRTTRDRRQVSTGTRRACRRRVIATTRGSARNLRTTTTTRTTVLPRRAAGRDPATHPGLHDGRERRPRGGEPPSPLRACQAPPLWSALGRAAFQRHDCARPFPADWDGAGRSLAPWLRASFPKSWPRSMRPPPPPRALASGRRDDRPVTRDLHPLGQTACEYLTALDGTGYDVCVRSDAPFDLRAPRGARLAVPHNNRRACVGGACAEVSIASGATRVPA